MPYSLNDRQHFAYLNTVYYWIIVVAHSSYHRISSYFLNGLTMWENLFWDAVYKVQLWVAIVTLVELGANVMFL